jgi:hypothetical protein
LSDFYTTSTNCCILPVSFSSVGFFLYKPIYITRHFKNVQYFSKSSLLNEVYFQEKLNFGTFWNMHFFRFCFVNIKMLPYNTPLGVQRLYAIYRYSIKFSFHCLKLFAATAADIWRENKNKKSVIFKTFLLIFIHKRMKFNSM